MLKTKSLHKMSKFINALAAHFDENGKSDGKLAPEVTNQLEAIENDFYGLMDRYAYSHIDMHGKPIHIDSATAKAFDELVASVRATEGERGNSLERWFNTLTQYPEGTLDGVLHVEQQVKEINEQQVQEAQCEKESKISYDAATTLTVTGTLVNPENH